jgi:hypothetical protein
MRDTGGPFTASQSVTGTLPLVCYRIDFWSIAGTSAAAQDTSGTGCATKVSFGTGSTDFKYPTNSYTQTTAFFRATQADDILTISVLA